MAQLTSKEIEEISTSTVVVFRLDSGYEDETKLQLMLDLAIDNGAHIIVFREETDPDVDVPPVLLGYQDWEVVDGTEKDLSNAVMRFLDLKPSQPATIWTGNYRDRPA